jgi:hypothetical protein
MDKDIISNLLKVVFPQYRLENYITSSGYTISSYNENFDIVFEINAYPVSSPILVVYNQTYTLSDLGVLRSIFDMHQKGLFSFEFKGIK